MDFDHNNNVRADDEDRLSSLPLELIHRILSRFNTKFVVQTCLLLSPRWKLIWTSMPCLKFSSGDFKTIPKFAEFVKHVLSHRNHKVLTVDTNPKAHHEFSPCLFSSETTLCLNGISLCDDERESVDLFSKCVNLQNLTLEDITVRAKVFRHSTSKVTILHTGLRTVFIQ
ncbi:putative F-box/FBD/LRR-repeat protein At5g22610 [Rutidosis leptorrhynchoides]|uniref:putative F-box/FBD/LRR-repeat protein At5g22610 n=1 Tax=Rutidosis leptorrhynchoides TaxID=125765 RepID=UPI003A98EAEA